ncbi:Mobile element protein [Myxococcus hansupus]|uniref:Mobile element protein n=1 Tax=Pseudomyxococcus hansupus TaxID=1297742 RepID=A0A0H4WW07_9BACT|nr:Mobile element protein [Myxococcus hansupus]
MATCEANGVNPEAYLADVLLRVQTHPNSRIRELLPHEWKRRRIAEPPDVALQLQPSPCTPPASRRSPNTVLVRPQPLTPRRCPDG